MCCLVLLCYAVSTNNFFIVFFNHTHSTQAFANQSTPSTFRFVVVVVSFPSMIIFIQARNAMQCFN